MALLETLTDDFETGTLDTTKWTDVSSGGGAAVVSGGVLNLNTNTYGNGGVQSVFYTLGPSSKLSAKVVGSSAGNRTRLAITEANGTRVAYSQMQILTTTVNLECADKSGTKWQSFFNYDPTAHAWLRMRFVASGTINTSVTTYFDTSPDGITWTQQAVSSARTWTDNYCRAELWNERNSTSADLTSTFDNINVAPPVPVNPNSLAESETLGAPSVTFAGPLLETLTDTFGTGALDTTKWTTVNTGSGTATVSGGVLNCNTGGNNTCGVRSATSYTLGRLSQISARVVIDPAGGAYTTSFMASYDPDGGAAAGGNSFFFINNGLLRFYAYNAGGTLASANITYSATAHAWLRMRFDIAGTSVTTYFDTSPDNAVWTQQYTATQAWTSGACYARLTAAGNGVTTARLTTFDNVNIVAPKTVASLVDDFLGTSLDTTKWTPTTAGGTVTVGGGNLQLSTTSTAINSRAEIQSTGDYYSFINSAAYARVTASTVANVFTYFMVVNAGTGNAYLGISGSTAYLTAVNSAAGSILNTTKPYSAASWAYVRIRMDAAGTNIYFERSADATTWTTEATAVNPGWGRSAQVKLYISNSAAAPSTATSLVDSVNLIPAVILGVNPDTITDPEALAAPAVILPVLVNPASLTDPETAGAPALGWSAQPQPGTITDPETLTAPDAVFLPPTLQPGGITDPQALGRPGISSDSAELDPDGIADPETVGAPGVTFQPDQLQPDALAESETLNTPGATYTPTRTPDSASDAETLGEPALPFVRSVGVDSLPEPELLAEPYLTFNPSQAGPLLPLADPETLGTPGASFFPSIINVVGINEAQALGAPSSSFIATYNGAYSTGDYGVGPYQGLNFAPAGIVDPETLDEPGIFGTIPVDPNNLLPLSIIDSETFAEPELPRLDATNWNYGASIYYGEGSVATTADGPTGDIKIYFGGGTGQTPDAVPTDNVIYGSGTYGYGNYYGAAQAPPPTGLPIAPAIPLFTNVAGRVQPPLHILGIGPWSPVIEWRGAPNYRVRGGAQPARPAMALPPATSKGFTLRLGDGGEARADLNFTRGSAVVIDEMDTDLWWRRKDPRTKDLEMIGRFNTAHVSVSTSDTGVSCSVQFVDYRTVLGERMVLKYLKPKNVPPTSMWDVGTPVVDILAWALPDNTGLDLSAAKGPDAFDLGKITYAFELPPGTLISDLMDSLEALSPHSWEWWVETPVDISLPPKLMFVIGERGKDKGVTLFDVGSGPTPIASWTRNGAADSYANSIYYSSGGTGVGKDAGGGVVETIPAQILQYGQRDVQDGSSSMYGGNVDALRKRATKKLTKYADRRPDYTVRLKQGFWRGRSHIDIGDTVTVFLRLGKEVLRDKYRVAEIAVEIDDNGMEDVTLSLGRLPTSADPRSKRSPLIRLVRTLKNFVPQSDGHIPEDD